MFPQGLKTGYPYSINKDVDDKNIDTKPKREKVCKVIVDRYMKYLEELTKWYSSRPTTNDTLLCVKKSQRRCLEGIEKLIKEAVKEKAKELK